MRGLREGLIKRKRSFPEKERNRARKKRYWDPEKSSVGGKSQSEIYGTTEIQIPHDESVRNPFVQKTAVKKKGRAGEQKRATRKAAG